jgi:hypothetical protein
MLVVELIDCRPMLLSATFLMRTAGSRGTFDNLPPPPPISFFFLFTFTIKTHHIGRRADVIAWPETGRVVSAVIFKKS